MNKKYLRRKEVGDYENYINLHEKVRNKLEFFYILEDQSEDHRIYDNFKKYALKDKSLSRDFKDIIDKPTSNKLGYVSDKFCLHVHSLRVPVDTKEIKYSKDAIEMSKLFNISSMPYVDSKYKLKKKSLTLLENVNYKNSNDIDLTTTYSKVDPKSLVSLIDSNFSKNE
jgi:hypothetical protein